MGGGLVSWCWVEVDCGACGPEPGTGDQEAIEGLGRAGGMSTV